MVLTKDELAKALQQEIRILLHLISKVDPAMLDYRPTPKQRSLLELLQYLTIMGPIHLGTIKTGSFDMPAWAALWRKEQAAAKTRTLDECKAAIAQQSALFTEIMNSLADADLRSEMQMFGQKASRGLWIVRLVWTHYAAYRMQLFLYLKSCGSAELNTVNLWVGVDAA